MIFETHAHYDDDAFNQDRDELINSLNTNGIGAVVNVGASLKTSRQTIELTKKYDFFYGAVGVHPSDTDELNDGNFGQLREMLKVPKIVAVGEIGLDYHYEDTDSDVQKKWFNAQLQLAREVKLPVIIHSREAARDTLEIMKEHKASEIGGVVHCYSYSVEQAREYLNMGFFFGIGGVVTFNNAKKLKEVVEYLPMEAIVLETDSPYLAPQPNRGKRNSSLYLPFIVSEIARVKGLSSEEVMKVTWNNACTLYRLDELKEN